MELRRFTLRDAQRVADLVGDKSVSQWTSNIPHPYTVSDAKEWIHRTESSSDRKPYAVELGGEIVACVSYWPYNEHSVEIGYWVGRAYWGQGIATQALTMLLSSDNFPKVPKVVARIMDGNIGSERVLQKCGFKFETDCVITQPNRQIKGLFFSKIKKRQPL